MPSQVEPAPPTIDFEDLATFIEDARTDLVIVTLRVIPGDAAAGERANYTGRALQLDEKLTDAFRGSAVLKLRSFVRRKHTSYSVGEVALPEEILIGSSQDIIGSSVVLQAVEDGQAVLARRSQTGPSDLGGPDGEVSAWALVATQDGQKPVVLIRRRRVVSSLSATRLAGGGVGQVPQPRRESVRIRRRNRRRLSR